jgi:Arc/MetJ-type ribon-helix-helix transcriptional regulator
MRQPDVERRMLSVRLPLDVHSWLDDQVTRYGSSQSSEVLRALRDRMARERQDKAVQR